MTDNKDTVRRMFDEVVNQGQIELIDELFDPEFQTETPQGILDLEGFKGYVLAWRTGFPDIHCDVDHLIAEGDEVAWSVRATGTHTGEFMGIPPTGNTADFDSLNIGEFRNGRAYRHRVMMDLTKMMGQLGVGVGPG
ncbi:MAG: ester cyclase [Actinomycetes bacterium]